MGRIASGLPGQNVGRKAHHFFMVGHATGYTGKPYGDTSNLSKACAKAYKRGYEKGVLDKMLDLGQRKCT